MNLPLTLSPLIKKGNKWIGNGYTISKYDDVSWTYFSTSDINYKESDNNSNGIKGKYVTCIAVGKNDNILIGTNNGFTVFGGKNRWQDYNGEKGLVNNQVFSVSIDKNGDKWMGTGDGVSQFDDINWFTYSSRPYASSIIYNAYPARLLIDESGNKWFSQKNYTGYHDLYKLNDTSFTSPSSFMTGITIYSFAVDKNNEKWVGAGDWFYMFNGQDRKDFLFLSRSL